MVMFEFVAVKILLCISRIKAFFDLSGDARARSALRESEKITAALIFLLIIVSTATSRAYDSAEKTVACVLSRFTILHDGPTTAHPTLLLHFVPSV
uniref:Uncharacterized protein n=1 Tax=Ixodes ricinus TaxID=34613 RepID=A0A6B0UDH1_IXORI